MVMDEMKGERTFDEQEVIGVFAVAEVEFFACVCGAPVIEEFIKGGRTW